MMNIGRMNTFSVVKLVDFGIYLEGGELGEILLPSREVPEGCQAGDQLQAFLYNDSRDRLIATTKTPLAQVGDLARLKVIDVNPVGAFLDWGLPKDLLVPRNEQLEPMHKGRSYLVYVALDTPGRRIFASTKLERFFSARQVDVQEGELVDLVITDRSEVGYTGPLSTRFASACSVRMKSMSNSKLDSRSGGMSSLCGRMGKSISAFKNRATTRSLKPRKPLYVF